MKSLGIVCVFLVLNVAWILGHNTKATSSIDENLQRKREDGNDDSGDTEETINDDFEGNLLNVKDTLIDSQIDAISKHNGYSLSLKKERNLNQPNIDILSLKRKRALSEERNRQGGRLRSNANVLNKKSPDRKFEFGRNIPIKRSLMPVVGPHETSSVLAADDTEFTRLLAVGKEVEQFYQFDLKTNSQTTYPLKVIGVMDVVFNGATRSIIWANYTMISNEANGVYSMNIDTMKIIPLARGIEVSSLAVDNGLLFFGKAWPLEHKTVNKMTITNKDYTQIADIEDKVSYSIVLDRVAQKLFLADWFKILQMDYDGRNRQVLVAGSWIFSLSFDPLTQLLYYSEWNQIKKLAPEIARRNESVTGEVVIELPTEPYDILYFGSVMYTGDTAGGKIRVSKPTSTLTKIIGSIQSKTVSVCLIP